MRVQNLKSRARTFGRLSSLIGVPRAALFSTQTVRPFAKPRLFHLSTPHAAFPLACRPGTSDFDVFTEMFIEREYSVIDDLEDVGLILDCGANVGYSAAYLLTRFPEAELIAVEPDAENFHVMDLNLQPYGERASAVHAAIWSHPAALAIVDEPYRDGRSWAIQVREARPHEAVDAEGLDIGTLLAQSAHERISILKMDIEGAEAVVFSSNYEGWLDVVDTLVVELHEDSSFGPASPVFERAIAGRGFTISHVHSLGGELTICKRA
jgi:FkbM family methyltransferase